jgi:hypothetical protein
MTSGLDFKFLFSNLRIHDQLEVLDYKAQKRPAADHPMIKTYYQQLCIYAPILEERKKIRPSKPHTFWKGESDKNDALISFDYDPKDVAEAEHVTKFNVNYLKPSGALGLNYQDWVAKQKFEKEIRFWIIETKGQVQDGVLQKDAAMTKVGGSAKP